MDGLRGSIGFKVLECGNVSANSIRFLDSGTLFDIFFNKLKQGRNAPRGFLEESFIDGLEDKITIGSDILQVEIPKDKFGLCIDLFQPHVDI